MTRRKPRMGCVHMSNLTRALGWAALGLSVFPCYEADEWVGDRLHECKSPRSFKGLSEGTTNPAVIARWWEENPEHAVGVRTDDLVVNLDIDMGGEKGKDGWYSLNSNDVDVPKTFFVTTPSGGEHHFYQYPVGRNLGPSQNIVLPTGVILDDVDRRAGRSYFIAWSDDVPAALADLTPAPDWLCTESGTVREAQFHGSARQWLETLAEGPVGGRVCSAINRIPLLDFGHEAMLKLQVELVKLGAEGHAGVENALELLQSAWLRPPYDTVKYETDWNAALAGAVNSSRWRSQ